MEPTVIEVTGPSPYSVTIGQGLDHEIVSAIGATGAHKVAIIHQPTVRSAAESLSQQVRAAGLVAHAWEVPDAEDAKTLATAGTLWNALGEEGFSRRDVVVGLGGGAATDLAGFVAAAWMRGIRVIQCPTTLLAMVDASVGGKTGINTAVGKNLVGAFHEPTAVFIDADHLTQLPQRDLIAGSAEIIKTGFIADEDILRRYEEDPQDCLRPGSPLVELIVRSVRVKASVVSQDLTESGMREILNYGHTFGHAVERYEDFRWRHGDAVAVGMMYVAHLSHKRGLIDEVLLARHHDILTSVGLPTHYPAGRFSELYEAMTLDKKNRRGHIRFVALAGEVGNMTRIEGPTKDELREAYEAIAGE